MPNYRRIYIDGGTYFFTVDTYKRKTLLTRPKARGTLRQAWKEIQALHPFDVIALCLLPDHIHCIWTLPEDDSNFSVRWNDIKGVFSKRYKKTDEYRHEKNEVRARRQEATIWQRRFWDHVIRDEEDFQNHINYIHYNPVKHGYVTKPSDWKYSTIHRYIREGLVEPDWGNSDGHDLYEFLYDYD